MGALVDSATFPAKVSGAVHLSHTLPPQPMTPLVAPQPAAGAPQSPSRSRRTRGPATAKFYRRPATGAAHEQRQEFGKTWGALNSAAAKRLREDRL